MAQDTEVIDGEIVESKPSEVNSSEILMNLESIIKSNLAEIDKLEIEAKKHKEILEIVYVPKLRRKTSGF